jgi:small subunit ribosomal protein S16
MAVKLRLRREGAKKQPHFRVVAADARSPRDGRFIEIIGEYHPAEDPSRIEIDEERALYWLNNGAQPTSSVETLLRVTGVWERFKPGDKPKRDRASREKEKAARKAARAKKTPEAEEEAAKPEATPEPAEPAEETAAAEETAEPAAEAEETAEAAAEPGPEETAAPAAEAEDAPEEEPADAKAAADETDEEEKA